jgi:NADPH2 dehydrogenase
VGLIVVEATCICPEGRLAQSQLGLRNDEQIHGHSVITEACHRHGSIVLVQIHHGGYSTHPACGIPIGPSAIELRSFKGMLTTKELTRSEVIGLRDRFIEAAVRAKEADYDGVQLHACHN